MDANGTRFHLLLGQGDWARCSGPDGAALDGSPGLGWDPGRHEITLDPKLLRFPSTGEPGLTPDARRGAARDAFGNWYRVGTDRASIEVLSSGSRRLSTFWPAVPGESTAAAGGDFEAESLPVEPTVPLGGLAVTEDGYLVAGTLDPGGLLVFDLYSGGAPRRRTWPIPFAPRDMVARVGGGVWVLDAPAEDPARVWELDRRLDVIGAVTAQESAPPDFTAEDGSEPQDLQRPPIQESQAWPLPAGQPVGLAAMDGLGVLVLYPDPARVYLLVGGQVVGEAAGTESLADRIEMPADGAAFRLVAHACALGTPAADDPVAWKARLYIAGVDGNQAYAFGMYLEGDQIRLVATDEYYPMRLYSGRALVWADGTTWYDCGDLWVRLLEQQRPRYAESGEVRTPVLDSGEPGCVWHRLLLDGCIPATTSMEVFTRAADVLDASAPLPQWEREPSPYLRGDGPELPYLPTATGAGRGTWELLFQRARGRYLQVRLVLHGDGRSTPRVRALRAWYPRFSYLERYLPAVYREDAQSASFLDRFLANFEGMFTTLEDRIAAAQLLFDATSAPPETLDWLATWLGVALDPAWDACRRRLFIRHAVEFFAARGTVRGLQLALRLALDECVDERLFARPDAASRRVAPVRIVERFRTRRTARALLGDVSTAVPLPALRSDAASWTPGAGGAELDRRYREALGLPAGTRFPLDEAAGADGWGDFARRTLGFVPAAGAEERARWRDWLRRHHATIAEVRAITGTGWSAFEDVRLPADAPASAAYLAEWRAFLEAEPTRVRAAWRDFLARRYRNASALNAAWHTSWPRIADVALPDRLPADGAPLVDWVAFEGTVLVMHGNAHRFTVMLPVARHLRSDPALQARRLARARAVLDLEKPAHTTYELRFYWAMFRVGEARVGEDTLLDLGSRSPELMGPMVLGAGYLAEAYLAARPGEDAPARVQLGRDRVGRSARLGGP